MLTKEQLEHILNTLQTQREECIHYGERSSYKALYAQDLANIDLALQIVNEALETAKEG